MVVLYRPDQHTGTAAGNEDTPMIALDIATSLSEVGADAVRGYRIIGCSDGSETSNNIIQKGLAFPRKQSGTEVSSGR